MRRDWEDRNLTNINRLEARTILVPYLGKEQALLGDRSQSSLYQSLNGVWKFGFFPNPQSATEGFQEEEGLPRGLTPRAMVDRGQRHRGASEPLDAVGARLSSLSK